MEYTKQQVEAAINCLKRGGGIAEYESDGYFPIYDSDVLNGLIAAVELAGPDYKYQSNYEDVLQVAPDLCTKDQLRTWLTYMLRGDRWCNGSLVEHMRSGRLKQSLEAVLPHL